MPEPVDWPSLADELALSEVLFGRHGPGRLAAWLEGEVARVNDREFARSFSDHLDVPGAVTDDYLHRRICTSSGSLLGGIRFFGRDISRPFVEVIAHSFDDLDRLRHCVGREWSMFAPLALRLRARPGGLSGPHVVLDKTVHVASCRDMRPPSSQVWLEPFDRVGNAEAIMHTRYQRLAVDDPTLARNVFPATNADLQLWHTAGQLHAVRTAEAVVGLFAVAPGRVGWIEGNEINEEVIAVEHQGHGYAALAQAAWAASTARDDSELVVGTIDRLNTSSRKTAEAAGRPRVLETVFVSLEPRR